LAEVSHPVSKYNESLLANFVTSFTIRAAFNGIFLSLHQQAHLFHLPFRFGAI
jgi:hypothetical protein